MLFLFNHVCFVCICKSIIVKAILSFLFENKRGDVAARVAEIELSALENVEDWDEMGEMPEESEEEMDYPSNLPEK